MIYFLGKYFDYCSKRQDKNLIYKKIYNFHYYCYYYLVLKSNITSLLLILVNVAKYNVHGSYLLLYCTRAERLLLAKLVYKRDKIETALTGCLQFYTILNKIFRSRLLRRKISQTVQLKAAITKSPFQF